MCGGGSGGGPGAGGGGSWFPSGQAFFICFFRQKATIVFHSLKARVFLCGDEGEGTEAFLVNNVERSLLISCFNVCSSFQLPFHLLFRYVSEKMTFFCRISMFPDSLLASVYILKNLKGSRTNLKGLIDIILIIFVRR